MRTINPKKISIVSLKDSITEEYIAKEPYDSAQLDIMHIWVEYEAKEGWDGRPILDEVKYPAFILDEGEDRPEPKEGFAYGFAFITG